MSATTISVQRQRYWSHCNNFDCKVKRFFRVTMTMWLTQVQPQMSATYCGETTTAAQFKTLTINPLQKQHKMNNQSRTPKISAGLNKIQFPHISQSHHTRKLQAWNLKIKKEKKIEFLIQQHQSPAKRTSYAFLKNRHESRNVECGPRFNRHE